MKLSQNSLKIINIRLALYFCVLFLICIVLFFYSFITAVIMSSFILILSSVSFIIFNCMAASLSFFISDHMLIIKYKLIGVNILKINPNQIQFIKYISTPLERRYNLKTIIFNLSGTEIFLPALENLQVALIDSYFLKYESLNKGNFLSYEL